MKNNLLTFLLAGSLVAGFGCSSNKVDRNVGPDLSPVDGLEKASATDQAETAQTAPDSIGAVRVADSVREAR